MRFRALGLALLTLAALTLSTCGAGGGSRHARLQVRPTGTYATAHGSRLRVKLIVKPGGSVSSYDATLSWTLPAFPATTGYNVFQDGVQVGSPASSPYTFHGLACGTTYTLGAQAHNGSGGTGPTYSTSYATPACAGGASGVTAFADTFGGTSVATGPNQWTVVDNTIGNTNNFQCDRADHVAETGGFLAMTLTSGSYTCPGPVGGNGAITSGCPSACSTSVAGADVTARDQAFKYGTLTVTARLPGANGTPWPTLWLLGNYCQHPQFLVAGNDPAPCSWPSVGSEEIDIEDLTGPASYTNLRATSITGAGNDVCNGAAGLSDMSANTHVYQMVWTSGSIVMKVDGATQCTLTTDIPTSLMFPLFTDGMQGTSLPSQPKLYVQNMTVTPAGPDITTASNWPSVGGSIVQGGTLTAANGTWTGSPTAYAYQWMQCDGSGNACSFVTSGSSCSATPFTCSNNYTTVAGDVGHTMQALVRATNASGATQYGSPASGVILSTGSFPCAFTHAAGTTGSGTSETGIGTCWDTNTGVQNGTGSSEAAVIASPAAAGVTQINSDVTVNSGGSCTPSGACTGNPAVIDHKYIVGCVAVNAGANNVTIKNSLLVSPDQCQSSTGGVAGSVLNAGKDPGAPTGLLVQDTTVDGGTGNGGPGAGESDYGVDIPHGECLRCNILHSDQGAYGYGTIANPSLFSYAYFHDPMVQQSWETTGNCGHRNGAWIDGGTYVTLDHSYVMMTGPLGPSWGCVTAAISLQGDFTNSNVTFTNNYAEGDSSANFTLGQCADSNIVIQNNIESTFNGKADYGGEGGSNVHSGVTWSGNTFEGGGTVSNPTGCP